MDLRSVYISNGIGIVILLILQYVSRTKILRRRAEDRIYFFMVCGVLLSCIMEALSYWLDGKTFIGAIAINYIANTYLFTVNLLLPFCVLIYVDLGLYGDLSRIVKKYKPQIIIGTIMLAITYLNLLVPIVFSISEQNIYERKPFSYFYYAVILYFCLSGIVLTWRYEKENGAKAFFNINMFMLPILIGAGLQFLFYGLSIAWVAAALGLVGLFMMQQNEMAYIDSLSGTYNRQYLNHILSAWNGRGRSFAGVMMDIDYFKSINDNFGHSEGDNAIRTVADILKRSRCGSEWIFRFAGDEFIVLKMTDDPGGMTEYMDNVTRNLEQYNSEGHAYRLSVSYGMGQYRSEGIDAFMKELDDGMYAMKQGHHNSIQMQN